MLRYRNRSILGTIILWLSLTLHASVGLTQERTEASRTVEAYNWPRPSKPWRSTWIGGELVGSDWSVYTGTTSVLFGDDIRENGWRVRTIGGYGRYRYEANRTVGTSTQRMNFDGHHGFGDLLIGYQQQVKNWTIKGFIGITTARHVVIPFDPENSVSGSAYGLTGALETWWNISEQSWLSTNLHGSTLFDSYQASTRWGYRLRPSISVGLEAGISGNSDYSATRTAGFGRYEWNSGEIRLSAGIYADRNHETRPYASMNFVFQY